MRNKTRSIARYSCREHRNTLTYVTSSEARLVPRAFVAASSLRTTRYDALFAAPSAIRLRRLSGRISVQTFSMYCRHSALGPRFPTARQPAGMLLSSRHMEYCSSSFMTTAYVSSADAFMRAPSLLVSYDVMLEVPHLHESTRKTCASPWLGKALGNDVVPDDREKISLFATIMYSCATKPQEVHNVRSPLSIGCSQYRDNSTSVVGCAR
jgi:hypothetical protein